MAIQHTSVIALPLTTARKLLTPFLSLHRY